MDSPTIDHSDWEIVGETLSKKLVYRHHPDGDPTLVKWEIDSYRSEIDGRLNLVMSVLMRPGIMRPGCETVMLGQLAEADSLLEAKFVQVRAGAAHDGHTTVVNVLQRPDAILWASLWRKEKPLRLILLDSQSGETQVIMPTPNPSFKTIFDAYCVVRGGRPLFADTPYNEAVSGATENKFDDTIRSFAGGLARKLAGRW